MSDPDISNGAVADALAELGDLYELDGAIVHRVLAYRTAAKAVREAPVSVAALARQGRATELPGIGSTLQEKILTLAQTGSIPSAERLRAKFPAGLVAITRLPGLGPKRARLLYDELGIDSPQALHQAALAQRLRTVRGLGPKFEASVLASLDEFGDTLGDGPPARLLLPRAIEIGDALVKGLLARGVQAQLAGSARRGAESVKDLDVVAVSADPGALAVSLGELDEIESVLSAGTAGARARTHSGVAVDLRIGQPAQLGNLLQHFTGSGVHNAALREGAVARGLHVSEYGVLDDASGVRHLCASEQEVYALLGLDYIEPELRENRGELQAARLGRDGGSELPVLIEQADIRGTFTATQSPPTGAHRSRRWPWPRLISATNTWRSPTTPRATASATPSRPTSCGARSNWFAWRMSASTASTVLAGSEVNILPDGSLDYEDALLAELDWVIASVHTAFGMGEQAMTERMIAAAEHPLVDAIAHPTGRLIERRRPYAVDLEALFAAAARTGRSWRSTRTPTGATCRRSTPARRWPRASRSSSTPTPTGRRRWRTCAGA